ncbi:hypothetical protein CC1G_11115 [Coprinopsis cinerea okayama7|uniref:Uncharacterized protein n=1 Tax=Coprinopsis cinerea (strain Okayama-7 / 130 / ATCC MYA-4618 / FGSC 9003) TaxID=240176 RepID=A8P7R1_COPC7|nr:hypothetical protein CC1G_11115 [Coprinopsis cinerea okayama7\|eukprot:XP_001839415.2 hypothetical protein CC1G_11115 [Coprinopsis cinerea okayama7\
MVYPPNVTVTFGTSSTQLNVAALIKQTLLLMVRREFPQQSTVDAIVQTEAKRDVKAETRVLERLKGCRYVAKGTQTELVDLYKDIRELQTENDRLRRKLIELLKNLRRPVASAISPYSCPSCAARQTSPQPAEEPRPQDRIDMDIDKPERHQSALSPSKPSPARYASIAVQTDQPALSAPSSKDSPCEEDGDVEMDSLEATRSSRVSRLDSLPNTISSSGHASPPLDLHCTKQIPTPTLRYTPHSRSSPNHDTAPYRSTSPSPPIDTSKGSGPPNLQTSFTGTGTEKETRMPGSHRGVQSNEDAVKRGLSEEADRGSHNALNQQVLPDDEPNRRVDLDHEQSHSSSEQTVTSRSTEPQLQGSADHDAVVWVTKRHIEILYSSTIDQSQNTFYYSCRLCEADEPPATASFPSNAPYSALQRHCETAHLEDSATLRGLSAAQLEEIFARLNDDSE